MSDNFPEGFQMNRSILLFVLLLLLLGCLPIAAVATPIVYDISGSGTLWSGGFVNISGNILIEEHATYSPNGDAIYASFNILNFDFKVGTSDSYTSSATDGGVIMIEKDPPSPLRPDTDVFLRMYLNGIGTYPGTFGAVLLTPTFHHDDGTLYNRNVFAEDWLTLSPVIKLTQFDSFGFQEQMDITLTRNVPEPASFAYLLLGLLAVSYIRRFLRPAEREHWGLA
jgi:hypothetical protein